MNATPTQLSLLALAWGTYFIAHSLFASLTLKRRVAEHLPHLMPVYRILFNLFAVVLLALPLWLLYVYQGEPLWQWQGYEKWISNALRIGAIIAVIWTFKYYDGSEILGLRQLKEHSHRVEDQEGFHISPFHRHVRHPWYFLSLVYVWSGSMDSAWLVSAIMISLYFIIGSRLEERKLLEYHGEIYRRYAQAVPALIPLPWRYLTDEQVQVLLRNKTGKNTSGNT